MPTQSNYKLKNPSRSRLSVSLLIATSLSWSLSFRAWMIAGRWGNRRWRWPGIYRREVDSGTTMFISSRLIRTLPCWVRISSQLCQQRIILRMSETNYNSNKESQYRPRFLFVLANSARRNSHHPETGKYSRPNCPKMSNQCVRTRTMTTALILCISI